MTTIPFVKYHGAGNDFIMIDDREGLWNERISNEWVAKVCHRRFGIGADGLILLQQGSDGADFFMKYYNADGNTSTFCGNGGRCITAFAASLGIKKDNFRFLGTDGWHHASFNPEGNVILGMTDVNEIKKLDDHTFTLFTGSPHYVTFVNDVKSMDVRREGSMIRYSEAFGDKGINVNFVESISPDEIRIRTYERGVEDETMACGTGVVAAAIANSFFRNSYSGRAKVHAEGGELQVTYKRNGDSQFVSVDLIGPAVEVYRGTVPI